MYVFHCLMFQVGTDIIDEWGVMLHLLDVVVEQELWDYAQPGFWNDFDMLEIGNGGMTHDEYVTHFAIWCAFKAPLLLGNDIRNMATDTLELLKHSGMLEILNDPLGKSVKLVDRYYSHGGLTQREVVSQPCNTHDNNQQWIYLSADHTLVNVKSQWCMTVLGDMTIATRSCNIKEYPSQAWIFNKTSRQYHSVAHAGKCLTISNYLTNQARLRGCEERQSTFDWQGPNLWWMGYADAVNNTIEGDTLHSMLLKVLNSNNICAGVGSPQEINTFAGQLSGDRWVVMLLNRDTVFQNITIHFKNIDKGISDSRFGAYDVYESTFIGNFTESMTVLVKQHYAMLIKLQ